MKSFTLFKVLERLGSRGWRGVLENTRQLTGLLNRVLLAVSGGPSKGHCIAVYAMSRRIIDLCRRSDPLFASMYLKQVAFLLQQYVGANKEDRPRQKIFVSLTRCGLPRFIPPIYRKRIRLERDPVVIRIVLSVCTLSRVIQILPKSKRKVDLSTIEASRYPWTRKLSNLSARIQREGRSYFERYCPDISSRALHLGYRFGISLAAGPNTGTPAALQSYLSIMGLRVFDKLTVYHTLPLDGYGCLRDKDCGFFCDNAEVFYADRTYYIGDEVTEIIPARRQKHRIQLYLEELTRCAKHVYGDILRYPVYMAKLGVKLEGAGKVRVFVMGNPIIQVLLRPVHDWTMGVLSTLLTDGTYNQLAPLRRLAGSKSLYSYDLKSATDLFPVEHLVALLTSFFGEDFGLGWLYLMTNFSAAIPERGRRVRCLETVRFERGQPLGYYSSWSTFTLTHHLLVWMSADKVYPGVIFRNYAILGDDIVIADKQVAIEYASMISDAGAVLSMEKSLISHNGSCEFAKRFIIDNHLSSRKDVSPISIPLIRTLDRYSAPFIFPTLGVQHLRCAMRLKGAGYRVYSRFQEGGHPFKVMSGLSRKWRRLMVSLHSRGGITPLNILMWLTYPEFWVMDSYVIGYIHDYLLAALAPKDLDEDSFGRARLLWSDESENLFEYHLGPLVLRHLRYVIWHTNLLVFKDYSLESLLHPPMPPRGLHRRVDRVTVHRYGYFFKAWDKCQEVRGKKLYSYALSPGSSGRCDVVYTTLYQYKGLANAMFLNGW